MIKDQIIKAIEDAIGTKGINLEFPENEQFGDYSTNVAMVLAKKEGKNPRELADKIVSQISQSTNQPFDRVEVAGSGFINFWLKKDILVDNLMQIEKENEKYGKSDSGKGKTVVIDYSSPNIAKPFGIGHLRSTIIGQALYNLYSSTGHQVIGDNHLGDWGTQFGKLLYMLQDLSEKEIEKLNIEDLEKLYVEFHKRVEDDPEIEDAAREWFKKLEEGDTRAKNLWKYCVDISLAEFNRIYNLLGVKIDFAFGESYYESEMRQMMEEKALKKHLVKGEDGALIINLSKAGISTPLMFLKSDGATTYATRDLATIKFRVRKWDPNIFIYEVGAEQSLHFQQLFAAAGILGLVDGSVKLVHTAHGLYLAPDGKKFSTRKGKTVKLEEVLDEAIQRAKKLGNNDPEVAKMVGIGAIKYYDLMHSVSSNVIFDWEKMLNLEGNSGPYLQYTVARINSVLAKLKAKSEKLAISDLNDEELAILRSLVRFSEIIEDAAKNYSPNLLCNYLYDLAQKFNTFYNKYRIISSDNEQFRLSLAKGTGQVLKNGLKLLGIESPERM